jgi:hypothetical protein
MNNFSLSLTEKIKKVLKDSSEYEINLGSESGRSFLANQIMRAIAPVIEGKIKASTSKPDDDYISRYLRNIGRI